MVFAIAALLFQLTPLPTISGPAVASSAEVAKVDWPSVNANNPRTPESADAEPLLLANNTERIGAGVDGPATQSSADSGLSPASFASAVRSSESLASLRIETPDERPLRFVAPETLPSRRKWIALSVGQHAAATFDAATTRLAVSQGAVEADPLMRSFAKSPAIYGAIQVAPVVLDFAARRMQRSPNSFLQRTWWVPQAVATGMFVISGAHNLHVASQLH
jgi:hypothetical protein